MATHNHGRKTEMLGALIEQRGHLQDKLLVINQRIAIALGLGGKMQTVGNTATTAKSAPKKRGSKHVSAARRAALSANMKAYWVRRRAAEAAQQTAGESIQDVAGEFPTATPPEGDGA